MRTSRIITRSLALLIFLSALHHGISAEEKKEKPLVAATWKWTFAMPDGSRVEPKVRLKQDGDKLSGIASFHPGTETPISEGHILEDEVSFQVVRVRDGQMIVTKYQGKVKGDTIKGTVESNWAGENHSYDWEAKRAKETATGTWEWTVNYRGLDVVVKATLKQEGEKLTGKVGVGGRRGIDTKDGKVKHGDVSFQVARERDGEKISSKYHGKLDGDTIKGKVDSNFGGRERSNDWEAKRVSD